MTKKKYKVFILLFVLTFLGVKGTFLWNEYEEEERQRKVLQIKKIVFQNINEESLPEIITLDEDSYEITYSIDKELSKYIRKTLKRYKSDYAAVVVIENKTGKILAMEGRNGAEKKWNRGLTLTSSHPSASLFKVITSADLVENSDVDSSSIFNYRGKGTTLYKYQLKEKITKWSRSISFKRAFAFSNNVIFGKAAIGKTTPMNLYKTALKFGFNKKLMPDLPIGISSVEVPEGKFALAEMASGFNKSTLISPIHAAVISEVISNDGKIVYPNLIGEIKNAKTGEVIFKGRPKKVERILKSSTAQEISKMMEYTVKRGTARSGFRRISSKINKHVRIGGKTGSITGGLPFGKRDWFSAYVKEMNGDKGYSIAVMNINIEKWHVKSTNLAKDIIRYITKKKIVKLNRVSVRLNRAMNDGV